MTADLTDVTGFRGEKFVSISLTDYRNFGSPLFRPGFLGDKWPAIDFYVELLNVKGRTPYFFAQAKATAGGLSRTAQSLSISSKRKDIVRLLQLPGPTYLFGVHEPSRRVFVRSVHRGTRAHAITRIPVSHELTPENLKKLYDEVQAFWKGDHFKPEGSVFA